MEYSCGMAKTRQVGFRLPEDEYQKLMKVWARAKERTLDYAPLGDVVREAIGLKPLKVITQEERDFLSGRLPDIPSGKPEDNARLPERPLRIKPNRQ